MKKSKLMILIGILSLPIFAMAQGHHGGGHNRPHPHSDYRPHHGDNRHHGHSGKFWRWSVAWWAPVVKPCYYWHGQCHTHPRYYR